MPSSLLGALRSVRPAACRPIRSPAVGQSGSDRTTPWSTPASAALAPKDLAEASGSDDLQCESREGEDVMTTMVVAPIAAHIGRRSELGACRGMMFRRYLIRADEAWHDSPHQQGNHRSCLSRTASGRATRHAGSVRAPAAQLHAPPLSDERASQTGFDRDETQASSRSTARFRFCLPAQVPLLLLLCQRSGCDRLVRDGGGRLREVPDAAGEVALERADGVAVRLAF